MYLYIHCWIHTRSIAVVCGLHVFLVFNLQTKEKINFQRNFTITSMLYIWKCIYLTFCLLIYIFACLYFNKFLYLQISKMFKCFDYTYMNISKNAYAYTYMYLRKYEVIFINKKRGIHINAMNITTLVYCIVHMNLKLYSVANRLPYFH